MADLEQIVGLGGFEYDLVTLPQDLEALINTERNQTSKQAQQLNIYELD